MTDVDVLIIGGGAAGLQAANQIHTGATVMVVDASDHIGGRLRTAQISGAAVDLGAAWCREYGLDAHARLTACFSRWSQ